MVDSQVFHAPGNRVRVPRNGNLIDQCFLKLIGHDFAYLLGPLSVFHLIGDGYCCPVFREVGGDRLSDT